MGNSTGLVILTDLEHSVRDVSPNNPRCHHNGSSRTALGSRRPIPPRGQSALLAGAFRGCNSRVRAHEKGRSSSGSCRAAPGNSRLLPPRARSGLLARAFSLMQIATASTRKGEAQLAQARQRSTTSGSLLRFPRRASWRKGGLPKQISSRTSRQIFESAVRRLRERSPRFEFGATRSAKNQRAERNFNR